MRLIDLTHENARVHFLKSSSYFNADLPGYLSFTPILDDVAAILTNRSFDDFGCRQPNNFSDVNYKLISNKDGKLAWRPFELIHPVLYVSLVNIICEEKSWDLIQRRMKEFEGGAVKCCSVPVVSDTSESDVAAQVSKWWKEFEQRSIVYSLEFSHLIHTDVTNCYGSLYTHSIPWALHELDQAKKLKNDKALIGNKIDRHMQAGRYGQTNGIPQGSVLMDFVAELVLGYVDLIISKKLDGLKDAKILRYRDDYRIFANSDDVAEDVIKAVSDALRVVGMTLGAAKTVVSKNVVKGSIKADKLAAIALQDLGVSNAKTIQKQLLRLHSFGCEYPNSGALRRLLSDFYAALTHQKVYSDDVDVQVAIVTDIAFTSPSTFPAVAGILSYLISKASEKQKEQLWMSVRNKMKRIPYNGYLDIWLQRVIKPQKLNIKFDSAEVICKVVEKERIELWKSDWILNGHLKTALDSARILIRDPIAEDEVVNANEVRLFREKAWEY